MKRLCDIINSIFGLLIFAPIMLVIALIIKLTTKEPVFYSQMRTGLQEKAFYVYEFRTMQGLVDKVGDSVITEIDPRFRLCRSLPSIGLDTVIFCGIW